MITRDDITTVFGSIKLLANLLEVTPQSIYTMLDGKRDTTVLEDKIIGHLFRSKPEILLRLTENFKGNTTNG